jgi:DNA-binding MarR family transcriptional regulator
MPRETIETLEDEASAAFFRLLNKILWGRKYPRDYGSGELLHMAEAEILDRVGGIQEPTTTLLADELGVSKAAISTLVNKLEDKGYLRKTTSTLHSNIKHLSLTKKGEKSRAGFRAYRDQLHNFLDGVSKAELRGHINVLLRMESFIDVLHDQLKEDLDLKRGK